MDGMKNYKVTGYNKHGSFQTVYVSAETSSLALIIGKDHGLIHQIMIKNSNIGGFTK